jgi:hypothetical protein
MTEKGLLRWMQKQERAAKDAVRFGDSGVETMERALAIADRAKADIKSEGYTIVRTAEMGAAIVGEREWLAAKA